MLTKALEPEAVAMFVKHLPVDRRLDEEHEDLLHTFAPGSRYIVEDAGGMYSEILEQAGSESLAANSCNCLYPSLLSPIYHIMMIILIS